MMDQVLQDHPQSAQAHDVAAELYARGGASPRARQEAHHDIHAPDMKRCCIGRPTFCRDARVPT